MKKRNLNNALVLAAALGLSGCATILNGTKQTVSFNSTPPGAKIYVDGVPVGTTPFVCEMKRGRCPEIVMKKDGFLDEKYTPTDSLNVGSYIGGNLALCLVYVGLIGFIVDPITGGMWEYDYPNIDLTLTPVGSGRSPSPSSQTSDDVAEVEEPAIEAAAFPQENFVDAAEIDAADVDSAIPVNPQTRKNIFVCVIANENYSKTGVENVPFAENDGNVFAEYAKRTLGVPEKRVLVRRNASAGEIRAAVSWMLQRAKVYPNAELIFYYSGHGVPAGTGKKVYLLPTDVSPSVAEYAGISTEELFRQLGESGAARISVFLDSCFSGMRRDDGALAASRGVRLKAEEAPPRGKMVVFSAASADETAFSFGEKKHGLFTWCLLKKLQETGGNVSYSELGEYLKRRVPQLALEYNERVQTPTCRWTEEFSAAGAPNRKLVE